MRNLIFCVLLSSCSSGVIEVVSDDGLAKLVVPAGALSAETEITITARPNPEGSGFVGPVIYDFAPEGLTFAKPAELTVTIDPSLELSKLFFAKLEDGWVGAHDEVKSIDEAARTMTVALTGFSAHGPTSCPPSGCLSAELFQSPRRIVVNWHGASTLQRARCVFPCTVTPAELNDPDESLFADFSNTQGEVIDAPIPTVGAVYWYRIRTGMTTRQKLYVVVIGVAPVPEAVVDFRAIAQADGTIALTWTPSTSPGVTYRVMRQGPCGRAIEIPGQVDTTVSAGVRYEYTIVATNAQGDSAPVTSAATARIAPGGCSVSVPNCSELVLRSGTIQIPVTLTSTETTPFTLRLDDAAEVGTGTFSPASITTGATTLSVLGEAFPNGPAFARIVATGASGSCSIPIELKSSSATNEVTISVRGDDGLPFNPLWVGARAGNQPWTRIMGSTSEFTADVMVSTGAYSIAVVCADGYAVVHELTLEETRDVFVTCSTGNESTITGTVSNLASGCAEVSVGRDPFPLCVSEAAPQWFANRRLGAADVLVATKPSTSGEVNGFKFFRGASLMQTGNVIDVSNTIAPQAQQITITPNLLGMNARISYLTASGRMSVGRSSSGFASMVNYSGVPAISQGAGDIHEFTMVSSVFVERHFFTTPADLHINLGNGQPSLVWPLPTVAFSGTTAEVQFTRPATAMLYRHTISSYSELTHVARQLSAFVSVGWLAANNVSGAYTLPKLEGAPGYQASWVLTDTASDTYTGEAQAGLSVAKQVAFNGGRYDRLNHGDVMQSAPRSGPIP